MKNKMIAQIILYLAVAAWLFNGYMQITESKRWMYLAVAILFAIGAIVCIVNFLRHKNDDESAAKKEKNDEE